jgi:hypothetical protein
MGHGTYATTRATFESYRRFFDANLSLVTALGSYVLFRKRNLKQFPYNIVSIKRLVSYQNLRLITGGVLNEIF